MAKTIKELAKKFVCENCENDSQCFLTEYAYTSGANAVLEIIYAALFKSIAYKDTFYDVLNAVKELKGKQL